MTSARWGLWLSLVVLAAATTAACGDPATTGGDPTPGCRLASDCPVGQTCTDATCVDLQTCQGEDCPCLADADCAEAEWCDLSRGACLPVECTNSLECPLGAVCEAGRCLTDLSADRDRDGIPDREDSCPDLANAQDPDTDGDGRGDLCDDDDDNDAVLDADDRCPLVRDPDQFDGDGDGQGNACDPDWAGITIEGTLLTPDPVLPDFTRARITLAGVDAPATPDADGRYVFDGAVPRPGPIALSARLDGFTVASLVLLVPDGVTRFEAPPMAVAVRPVPMTGRVRLNDEPDSGGAQVAVRQQGRLTTLFPTRSGSITPSLVAGLDAPVVSPTTVRC